MRICMSLPGIVASARIAGSGGRSLPGDSCTSDQTMVPGFGRAFGNVGALLVEDRLLADGNRARRRRAPSHRLRARPGRQAPGGAVRRRSGRRRRVSRCRSRWYRLPSPGAAASVAVAAGVGCGWRRGRRLQARGGVGGWSPQRVGCRRIAADRRCRCRRIGGRGRLGRGRPALAAGVTEATDVPSPSEAMPPAGPGSTSEPSLFSRCVNFSACRLRPHPHR